MPRKRPNPQHEVEGSNPQPPVDVDPQPPVEGSDPVARGLARAREARAVGIREIGDLLDGLHPVHDAPRVAAGREALARLLRAEEEDQHR